MSEEHSDREPGQAGKPKLVIPDFATWDEEFEFWSTFSPLDFTDEGDEVEFDFSEARRRRKERLTE